MRPNDDLESFARRVVVSAYDPAWPAAFERERMAVEIQFDSVGLTVPHVEHIGSTAVPGLRAKPIIDVLVGVEDLCPFDMHRDCLVGLGYLHDAAAVRDEPNREVFRKEDPRGSRTHHVHLTLVGGPYWTRIRAFRDYLREHDDAAREYEALKMELARRYVHDSRSYARNKAGFVRRIEALAMHTRVT